MKNTHKSLMNGIKSLPAFPVVLVTIGENIMVAAAFHFYSFNPPSVMIGIKPEKYSFELIKEKMEFAINIPTVDQLNEVKICGNVSGKTEDKYKLSEFTRQRSNKIDSYIIKECLVNLECSVVHEINYDGSHRWFIGEIQEVHIDKAYRRSDALMFWLGQFRGLGGIIEGLSDEKIIEKK